MRTVEDVLLGRIIDLVAVYLSADVRELSKDIVRMIEREYVIKEREE